MGGHEHANDMQMTCKPTQDPAEGSGSAEDAGRVGSLPAREGDGDTQVLTPQCRRIQPSLRARGLVGGGGVPEHQPWFCCWLRKSRSLAPRQQEESRGPTRQPDSPRPTLRGKRPALCHTRLGQRGPESKPPEPGRGQSASEAKATNNKIH